MVSFGLAMTLAHGAGVGRQVEAEGLELLAELDGQRKADVAEADDGDGGAHVDLWLNECRR